MQGLIFSAYEDSSFEVNLQSSLEFPFNMFNQKSTFRDVGWRHRNVTWPAVIVAWSLHISSSDHVSLYLASRFSRICNHIFPHRVSSFGRDFSNMLSWRSLLLQASHIKCGRCRRSPPITQSLHYRPPRSWTWRAREHFGGYARGLLSSLLCWEFRHKSRGTFIKSPRPLLSSGFE